MTSTGVRANATAKPHQQTTAFPEKWTADTHRHENVLFSLPPRSMVGWLFLKLYILLYFFFFLVKKIGIYILTTGMMLSKTPSQKHDRHTQVHIMSRQSSEPLTGTGIWFPLPMSTAFPQVSEPKGRKKGGVWGHFFNGYILKG